MNKSYEMLSESLVLESRIDILTSAVMDFTAAKKMKKATIPTSVMKAIKKGQEAEQILVKKGIMKQIDKLIPMAERMLPKFRDKPTILKAVSALAILKSLKEKTNPKTELINIGAGVKNVSLNDTGGLVALGTVLAGIISSGVLLGSVAPAIVFSLIIFVLTHLATG